MKNENAIKYIQNLIKKLISTAKIDHYYEHDPPSYHFKVETDEKTIKIKFEERTVC